MKITREHHFEASPEECWEMFSDPSSHVAKFEGMGHRNLEVVEKKKTKKKLRMVISRDVDVEVPGFAKKVVQPTNTVISTDEWNDNGDGTYGGGFELDTKGVPIETSGVTLLEPDGDGGSDYTIVIEIKVKVPLIGGRLEKFAKGIINAQMDKEFELGDAWLAR